MARWERRQAETWHELARGAFDHAEYGDYTVTERSGAMVHHTSHRRIDVTVVVFNDGRSFPMRGRHDMPYPTGTKVIIDENEVGGRRIRAAL
jgi:hypothetical protein